jgi:DNA-nicking Smr family endonuclease
VPTESKKKGGGGNKVPPEDSMLWHAYTDQEVTPLPPLENMAKQDPFKKPRVYAKEKEIDPLSLPNIHFKKNSDHPPQLDLRTEQKLRRGKITIDARLDLHGYTQQQAHQELTRFLLRCYGAGFRCVLIITGKGIKNLDKPEEQTRGVLNRNVPRWIMDPPLKDIVLKYSIATIKDGGSGAYYIYLKRKRDY